MFVFQTINQLMMTIEITQPSLFAQSSSSLWYNQIHMSYLGDSRRKCFYHTQVQVSVSMNSDPVNEKIQVNNQQRKYFSMNLKDILDQPKQYIYVNKYEHPTVTLAMNFLNPVGE